MNKSPGLPQKKLTLKVNNSPKKIPPPIDSEGGIFCLAVLNKITYKR